MADEALILKPGRSLQLAAVLILAHALAVAAAWIALPTWWWSALLSVAIALNLFASLTRHALRTASQAVVEIVLRPDATARFTLRDGRTIEGPLHPGSFVAASLVIVTLAVRPRHRWVRAVVASDALAPDAFRRQRMWLRWMRPGGQRQ